MWNRNTMPNKPAPPNAGIASRLTIGHRWPGVGAAGRYRVHTRTVSSCGNQEQHLVRPAAWNARRGKTLNT